MPLPQKIGDHITIPAGNYNLRRWIEWHGFVMDSSQPGFLMMRRDFREGSFSHYPEPLYPLARRRLR